MCGITGIVRWGPVDRGSLLEEIGRMTRAVAHRGPDDEQVHVEGPVALGFRRLAIIDPGGGRQPMTSEDGSVVLVCNGEVYNFRELREELTGLGHVFRTRCDCEVIVHAYEQWGTECLQRLRGMFAFAIADFRQRKVLLARDHFPRVPRPMGSRRPPWCPARSDKCCSAVLGREGAPVRDRPPIGTRRHLLG